jgi:hypothetical protein
LLALAPGARAETWIRAESQHFLVYSSIGEADTREHIVQLEAFKYLAELILGTNPKDTAANTKFTIYLLGQHDDIKTVMPTASRYVAGVYFHCVENSQAFVHAPQWYGAEMDYGLQVLLHEYSHHLMFSRARRIYPSWYVEGFAEYLGATKLQDGRYRLGVRQDGRAAQLNSSDKWLDLETMLDPTRFAAAVKDEKVNAFQFYAQSWILAHYMLSDSARTQAFNNYFDRVGRGEKGAESFEAATGMTLAKLRAELGAYRRSYSALLVNVPSLPDITIKTSGLPREQGAYLIESAALQVCPKKKYGTRLVEKFRALRAKSPGDLRLRVELGRAELLFGDRKAARTELESIAVDAALAFDVAYLLGRTYFEEARPETAEQIAARNTASEHFLEAYQLDRTHPANLYFLSRSLDTEGAPSKAVVNAGTSAAVLAPSVPEYATHAASVSLRVGDRDTAIRVLQPLASNPHKLEYAAQVSALIGAIRAKEEFASLIGKLEDLGLPPKEKEEDEK